MHAVDVKHLVVVVEVVVVRRVVVRGGEGREGGTEQDYRVTTTEDQQI